MISNWHFVDPDSGLEKVNEYCQKLCRTLCRNLGLLCTKTYMRRSAVSCATAGI